MLLFENAGCVGYFIDGSNLIERELYHIALFGYCLQYTLSNPPHSIRNELEASGFVKFFGSLDESHIAFIDKVGETQSLVLVLFGHRNDES